ncbi:MAG: hypothetical protein ACK4K4_05425 [Caldimicrobium sp.]
MVIKVHKGTYQIIRKKEIILSTDFLGAGVAIGFIHKTQNVYGLASFILPYRDEDIEIEGFWLYSGETLLELFQAELQSLKIDLEEAKWILAGGSIFKENPNFLDLSEKNLKIAIAWLKRNGLLNQTLFKTNMPYPLILAINPKEQRFEVKIKNKKVEYYE